MKKLLIAFVAMIATLNLFAQTDEPQQQNAATIQTQKTQEDGVILKDGKVCLVENGETKPVTGIILTANGMQVTPSGTLIFENGEKARLREGDFVSLSGAVARPIPIGTEVASKH